MTLSAPKATNEKDPEPAQLPARVRPVEQELIAHPCNVEHADPQQTLGVSRRRLLDRCHEPTLETA
jgi:hypothetical protein